jgi:hypothetical protein
MNSNLFYTSLADQAVDFHLFTARSMERHNGLPPAIPIG